MVDKILILWYFIPFNSILCLANFLENIQTKAEIVSLLHPFGEGENVNKDSARIACLVLALMPACGQLPDCSVITCVSGIPVTAPDGVFTPEFSTRVERIISDARDYWKLDDAMLEGWRIRFVEGTIQCGDKSDAIGCATNNELIVMLMTDRWRPCVEGTALLHEFGHVRFPDDPDHGRVEWCGQDAVYHNYESLPGCQGIVKARMEPIRCYH